MDDRAVLRLRDQLAGLRQRLVDEDVEVCGLARRVAVGLDDGDALERQREGDGVAAHNFAIGGTRDVDARLLGRRVDGVVAAVGLSSPCLPQAALSNSSAAIAAADLTRLMVIPALSHGEARSVHDHPRNPPATWRGPSCRRQASDPSPPEEAYGRVTNHLRGRVFQDFRYVSADGRQRPTHPAAVTPATSTPPTWSDPAQPGHDPDGSDPGRENRVAAMRRNEIGGSTAR